MLDAEQLENIAKELEDLAIQLQADTRTKSVAELIDKANLKLALVMAVDVVDKSPPPPVLDRKPKLVTD